MTQLPLAELWDDKGLVQATKLRDIGIDEIKDLLRTGSVSVVVADVGESLRWIEASQTYSFWKTEVAPHLYQESKPYLENYPGEYFYFATEWRLATGRAIIVLEKEH